MDSSADRATGLLSAQQQKFGLKLESTKGPVDAIVIEGIGKPGEN